MMIVRSNATALVGQNNTDAGILNDYDSLATRLVSTVEFMEQVRMQIAVTIIVAIHRVLRYILLQLYMG